jgi:hypothetical protein
MMKYLFIPRFSGDFRLESGPEDTCKFTVVDPTHDDIQILEPFFEACRGRGWVGPLDGVQRKGQTEVSMPVSIREVGPVLAGLITQHSTTWTAIRYGNGEVRLSDGNLLPADKPGDPEVTAVAVVERPYRGCPEPTPAARRASTVLRTFSTASQWDSFTKNGFMTAVGNVSGRAYRVWHKDEAWRRGHRRCLTVGADHHPVCVWRDDVPPEEQALALKLAVEHREAWLLTVGDGVVAEDFRDVRRFA